MPFTKGEISSLFDNIGGVALRKSCYTVVNMCTFCSPVDLVFRYLFIKKPEVVKDIRRVPIGWRPRGRWPCGLKQRGTGTGGIAGSSFQKIRRLVAVLRVSLYVTDMAKNRSVLVAAPKPPGMRPE